MSGKHNIFYGKFITDPSNPAGMLPASTDVVIKFADFLKGFAAGQTINVFIESTTGTATNAQHAKINACIREMANTIGDDFQELKKDIKKELGYCYGDDNYKSFADCSVEELGLVIKHIIKRGDFVGCNFR